MWERRRWESAEVPKASDLRRKRREKLGMRSRCFVLSPNEVSRTRPISMASLDLRFIIGGAGTLDTSRSASAVINIFYNIRPTLLLAYSTTPCSSWPCLFPSPLSSPSSLSQWILSGA